MAGRSQSALYAEIDLELSWSEDELPQVERTKHVHALHPYLGKFVPQLVEAFLRRYLRPGNTVYDPFVGSGTTLVEANVFGCDSIGCDISAFNCLLARVKTIAHSLPALDLALRGALEDARGRGTPQGFPATEWLQGWYAPKALDELLAYRAAVERLPPPARDVAKIVLSRAARSARSTTHFDLDFPKRPVRDEYFCHKHKRVCHPVDEASRFLRRYTADTVRRLSDFSLVRSERRAIVVHGDARTARLPFQADGIITSPPYPGLIDYHEQHRYAYELLGLEDRRKSEIGPAARGLSRAALAEYVSDMAAVFRTSAAQLRREGPVVIVVNDSRNLYPEILRQAGLELEERSTRHVNRRTGRRAGEFFEDVLVCRAVERNDSA
jgi:DNA methylase